MRAMRAMTATLVATLVGTVAMGARATAAQQMAMRAATGRSAADALEAIKRMSPQQRLVTPGEVAAVALLLASDEGRGINGQAINVDGGTVSY